MSSAGDYLSGVFSLSKLQVRWIVAREAIIKHLPPTKQNLSALAYSRWSFIGVCRKMHSDHWLVQHYRLLLGIVKFRVVHRLVVPFDAMLNNVSSGLTKSRVSASYLGESMLGEKSQALQLKPAPF